MQTSDAFPLTTAPAHKDRLSCLGEIALYAAVFLLTTLRFLIVKPLYSVERDGVVAQAITACVIGGVAFVGIFLALEKKLTARRFAVLVLVAGLALRIGYMLYTPASARQHDTFTKNFDGHETYAWTIFSTGKLPSSNAYQFYHPPLNALLQAGFMHFMEGLSNSLSRLLPFGEYFPEKFLAGCPEYIEAERYFLYSSCQILSVLYSFVACVTMLKILRLFDIRGKGAMLISAFVTLYPRNIQFSGMLNNDGVSYMFAILALYFALKWWKRDKGFGNILACGLCVGLGMMSKLSSATVCLPIAGIFVWEFVGSVKKNGEALSLQKLFAEYGVFLLVCAPLGLWFQVYAKLRFDQPFGFVFSNLNSKLYTGDHSFFSRFFIAFDWKEYFGSLWCRPFEGNYNLFNYALRSSIFGEFSYWQGEGFAVAATVLAFLSAFLLFAALIRALYLIFRYDRKDELRRRERKKSARDVFFTFLLVQSQALSEIYFYISMPYGCTMDFRYIMPMILGMGLTLWLVERRLTREGDVLSVTLGRLTAVSTSAFLVFSSLFYMTCI